ncbi:hypothetical protein FEM48_Zijuj10G0151100 [Ziziphus jujuba var. spinosa]|uniref:GCF C-terminal domain-containing protein n=1 Tax=Ziziphus jujuba var. spinosa TaxID=714518 RepID=A0A978UP36_ZIZJJ|nr:transcriptional repressor ILP1 isoform X2 [Ziziphus jujuba var. spinosa]XP_048318339.1 transcriptional repressor ILP1 isoform X3 [Ziziphus jujuba var. spinosa]KAH7516588.1 hypothetical protein FEM48_Zijuj10G0151100 [Ziziphus jujuba var. spinosa]
MSSRAKNFRRRAGDDDDDDNEDDNKNNTPSTTTAVKATSKPSASGPTTIPKPNKKTQNQAPKRLSFADDEDNDEAPSRPSSKPSNSSSKFSSRLAKPSSSHRMTSLKDRLAHSSSASSSSSSSPSILSNVQPQAGTYTKETLLELQKNTRTLASSRPSTESKSSSEPIIVLKGLVKSSDRISEIVTEAEELEGSEDDEDEEEVKEKMAKRDAQARLASMAIGKGRDSSSSGLAILSQAEIDAIRAKKERMRQSGPAAPDYISLDGGSNHGAAEGLSDEEPEFRSRIAMFGEKMDGIKKGVFEDVDARAMDVVGLRKESIEDGDDEDEEEKIWEEEQFRKGFGKRMDDGSSRVVSTGGVPVVVQNAPQQKFVYPTTARYSPVQSVSGSPSIGGASGALQGLSIISQNAGNSWKAIGDFTKKFQESYGRSVSSLTNSDENLSTSLLNVTALENSLSAHDEKYKFMQKLCYFVSILCDFLKHKAPFIEELEEQMQKFLEKRASVILERRAADNDDEMREVEAGVRAAMSVFSKKGGSNDIVAAKNAAQAALAALREQSNLPEKLDEFGRDVNLQKRMEMKGRAEARLRKKARFDSRKLSSMDVDSSSQKVEGESSTDESDSENTAYESHRKQILQTADQIFSDAAEEYSQLSMVKERFEECKRNYLSTYRDAYMSLSVPSLFSPYVRLELLKWDPLREKTDFLDMNWHSLLLDYGLREDGSGFATDDADANLVPVLVEKVALPILHHKIVHCWDMLSTKETKNAVAATSLVTDYVPASSEALADLLVAIRTCLADAVANLMVPTWSSQVLIAVPNASRVAAYRFGMSVRLLKNICLWKEILALPILEKLALDELLCGKILPHLRSIAPNVHDAITRTERIVASLSGVWSGPSVRGDHSRKLQPLVDYILSLGKTLEKKKHGLGVTESETSALARRLKKMLVELNEYDNARDIARTFHLKEAL